jgi:hypothetical protein
MSAYVFYRRNYLTDFSEFWHCLVSIYRPRIVTTLHELQSSFIDFLKECSL